MYNRTLLQIILIVACQKMVYCLSLFTPQCCPANTMKTQKSCKVESGTGLVTMVYSRRR